MADVEFNGFIWDEDKNQINIAKHDGISFNLASRIFADPFLYTEFDVEHSFEEDRDKNIGMISGTWILTVSSTERNGQIRIISARKATKNEVMIYEQNAKTLQIN